MNSTPAPISDEKFQALRASVKPYTAVILKTGPNRHMDGAETIIYSHGMRNVSLHLDGRLPVVCPATDNTEFRGLGIFNATVEETAIIMDGDPAIQAGVLTYEVHPVRSFPGSSLPA
ncbi:hypothetical protein [Rathayibacter soli]|uniref:hypothetical protein n=1 Tax=Rathayibacter soli TaxID=3144168 RepID=UPI0027E40E19|nr:hypothetical protein [Glaciibacter superstes]